MKRAWTALVVMLLALLTSDGALAWTEARPSGLVTEVAIDRDGAASVTLHIRWTVLGGRMQQFDLAELPTDLTLLEASAVAGNGTVVPVTTTTPAPGRIDVSLGDESHGVRRGTVDVLLRYATSLRAQGAIRRAGNDAVVELTTAPWARGIEGVELRVTLPASARQAQWVADDTPGVDAETTTELARDVLHASRRHLPAGERWVSRVAVDPSIFPWLATEVSRRPAMTRRAPRPYRDAALLTAGLLAAVAVIARYVRRDDATRRRVTPTVAAVCAIVGIVLQALHVLAVPLALPLGTALIALSLVATLPLPGAAKSAAWSPSRHVSDEAAALLMRASSPWPRCAALVLAFAALTLAMVAATGGRPCVAIVAFDVAAVMIFGVARAVRLAPPHDARALKDIAARLRDMVRKRGRARTVWKVRGEPLTSGALRLRVLPRPGWRFARGVRSVECHAQATPGALVVRSAPSLVLRVDAGSPLEKSLRMLAARVGSVEHRPEDGALDYRCELLGPEADVAWAGLRAVFDEMFVPAPSAAARSQAPEHAEHDRAATR